MNEEQNIDQSSEESLPSTENENVAETSTVNRQLLTNMEVHKHPHHVTHKKKWGEYLLEFFMLFLAVFLGFVAENLREHIVENQKGIQYIHSFVEDIEADKKTLSLQIPLFEKKVKTIDTLLLCFKNNTPDSAYKYFWEASWFYKFFPVDRTIQQLKNAGGMRLISNRAAVDSIIAYDRETKYMQIHIDNALTVNSHELADIESDIFDFTLIPDWGKGLPRNTLKYPVAAKLLTYDQQKIARYKNKLVNAQRDYSSQLRYLQSLKSRATRIIEFLNREKP